MASNMPTQPKKHLISNAPLRAAFLSSSLSSWDMARALGHERKRWTTNKTIPDATPVLRALGLKPEPAAEENRIRTHMQEATALRYAEALGLDPHEIGL